MHATQIAQGGKLADILAAVERLGAKPAQNQPITINETAR